MNTPGKILILDDEKDVVKLASKVLRSAGYEVFCYDDGRGAISTILRVEPDLILLDIRLPHLSGVDIFRILKRDPILQKIPVVFFSATATIDDLDLGELTAPEFVSKPYEIGALLELVRRVLRGGKVAT